MSGLVQHHELPKGRELSTLIALAAMQFTQVDARYRGGFMSVNSALQQAASGFSSVLAGAFVTTGPGGRLLGYPSLGFLSVGFFVLTVICAARLRAVAPYVCRTINPSIPSEEKIAA